MDNIWIFIYIFFLCSVHAFLLKTDSGLVFSFIRGDFISPVVRTLHHVLMSFCYLRTFLRKVLIAMMFVIRAIKFSFSFFMSLWKFILPINIYNSLVMLAKYFWVASASYNDHIFLYLKLGMKFTLSVVWKYFMEKIWRYNEYIFILFLYNVLLLYSL